MVIRKYVDIVEEIHMENGRRVDPPGKKAAAVAIIENPLANQYVDDLNPLIEIGERLGVILSERAVRSLGGGTMPVQSFGKAAVVGLGGELEHAAAILHPKLGHSVRSVVGGKAMMPSSKKMGSAGTEIDVPLHYCEAALVRSHFDTMTVKVGDAPRDNEIMVIVVLTDCGRPLPRIGGLQKQEVKVGDGLR